MKIKDIIRQPGQSVSFEFFPPKTEEGERKLLATIGRLELFGPSFVSVTYGAGGGTRKTTGRVVERIIRETHLTPMPHLTCCGQSREDLKEVLLGYRQLGVENILALRGDLPKDVAAMPATDGLGYARDLVLLAGKINSFCIGVALYPEGHLEAPSLESDLFYAKQKIEAGADFAITQMFFDNRFVYDLVERTEKAGIRIPIILGIMPITDFEKIRRFTQTCGASLPPSLVSRLERATSPGDVKRIGVDFATRQCDELRRNGFRRFHFFTLNQAEAVTEILHNLSLDGARH